MEKRKPQSQCAQTPRACRQRQGLTQRHSVAGKRYKESRRRGRSRAVSSLGLLGRREGDSERWAAAYSCSHLFSIRVCTLCTSSRAIRRMCCTSWRSAISVREEHKEYSDSEEWHFHIAYITLHISHFTLLCHHIWKLNCVSFLMLYSFFYVKGTLFKKKIVQNVLFRSFFFLKKKKFIFYLPKL